MLLQLAFMHLSHITAFTVLLLLTEASPLRSWRGLGIASARTPDAVAGGLSDYARTLVQEAHQKDMEIQRLSAELARRH